MSYQMYATRSHWRLRRAFTLTEMLVVLMIIALLVSMAMLVFRIPILYARRSQCQTNLKHVGEAYASIVRDHASNYRLPLPEAYGWAVRFKRDYLGGNPNSLWCTATGHSDGRGYEANGENAEGYSTAPEVKIRVFNGGAALYDLDTFTTYPFWNEGSHRDYGRTVGIWKINEEVYNNGQVNRNDLPQYVPGENPDQYWFVIEDQRYADDTGSYGSATGDQDFNDFDMHVRELPGGGVELTGYHRDAGYSFAVVDAEGNVYAEQGGTLGPIRLYGTDRVSYGMSMQVEDVARQAAGSSTIIAGDYREEMIYTGNWIGLDEGWDVNQAPRHMGQMNALRANGSVTLEDPDEIDPETPNGEHYWSPGLDAPGD
jgi:prepilin-type N-terminal cleavage/methylation domain-containing protein